MTLSLIHILNAGSIIGDGGRNVKRFCKKLMKEDLLHFVGTDAHRIDIRRPIIKPCVDYVIKKMGEDYAREIFVENPRRIVLR